MTTATFDNVLATIEAQRLRLEDLEDFKKEREEAKERKEAFDKLSRECQSLREGLHLRAPPVRAGVETLTIPAGTDEEEAEVQHAPDNRRNFVSQFMTGMARILFREVFRDD